MALTAAVSVSILAAGLALGWGYGLRRLKRQVNRGLHELRRPLQQAFLAAPDAGAGSPVEAALERSLAALDLLDAAANSRRPPIRRLPVDLRQIVEGCLELRRHGPTVEQPLLRWGATSNLVVGDPDRLRSVFDNLIENALVHGRPPVWISASGTRHSLRVSVGNAHPGPDRGSHARPPRPGGGHGLRIVRDLVAEHGGRFESRHRSEGYEAVVELPLSEPRVGSG
ncbi:MAG: sensor histidine kinase [bacterium]